MKLVGNLKKQVEQTSSKDEAREAIRMAGMELTDDELDTVAGGYCGETIPTIFGDETGGFHHGTHGQSEEAGQTDQ